MKIGIIGLQNSGKTTIFNALTGLNAEVTAYSSQKLEPNIGVVEVPDERIDWLSEHYQPKKTIYAHMEFTDFAGLSAGSKDNEAFSAESLGLIKTSEALALVVRNFTDEIICQSQGEPDPLADIDQIMEDMIISDMILVEKRLERIVKDKKRGINLAELQIEEHILTRINEQLNNSTPVRDLEFSAEEEKAIRGFRLLTEKPIMIILNSDENNFAKNEAVIAEIEKKFRVIELAGNFEMELSKMDSEEAEMFMEDMNISESAVNRLIRFSYNMLGLISFFTVGKDEVRAWTIVNGDNAVQAAGKIHSDLARGFIRAECFHYEKLKELGSEKALREKGMFRLEGKNYLVQDGDIINIRFSV
ncbi:MAG: redox-regulated ATPase YchF [Candidatus Cloacimonetes bacterium]|nr:redox-regulated ATPase YchF [Candidatus Cloacimonadota bacterium]